MSEYLQNKEYKKKVIKEIIKELHQGLSVEEAKKKFDKEAGSITSSEIAEIEQSLIKEGMPVDEIKKFCNVHALLFESSLSQIALKEESLGHPVHTFKLENREIEKLAEKIKSAAADELIENLKSLLEELKKIELHYVRKEQLLFPFLEKYGFMGPSKVMWGKHNEIRSLMKNAVSDIESAGVKKDFKIFKEKLLKPLIDEVEGMIFKEENILFPSAMEKLKTEDWIEILKESDDIGYCFIGKPVETSTILEELKKNISAIPKISSEDEISFPTGTLKLEELMLILNILPADITFIDSDDTVRYFSDNKDRVFVRTKSVIGRKVQNCHPPQSVETVEKILHAFKQGTRDYADFWINFNEKFVYIKFLALRDASSKYLGTIEITMDATAIRKLKGEKRLLNEKD